ncbi:hypothetical protein H072_11058 [Dactylellina haptotyla CBS 200.50]|uniref:Phosphatidic acid phosphatase type 2/haloperoxidase domain-containing protein n=1 Tax=Dactylellina haptotyla (strain CBS 200.50) TaxID=1284197 RepID=S7ZYJ3_DACHA|nr:hypothetical protein H072_11058 [Dactylellina haptotyla CBS 200.50]
MMRNRTGSGEGVLPVSHRRTHSGTGTSNKGRGIGSKIAHFLRQFGLDWLTILVIGIVALMIDKYVPDVGGKARYFRLLPGQSTSPQMEAFSHPYRKQIIPFWASAGLDIGIPALFISVVELCTRGNFTNFARGMLGACNSVIMCCFVQIIIKTLVGGFRPSFLEICQPQPNGPGVGWDGSWYKWTICTGDPEKINWALESFPSGHVATSWAAGVYLSLWINAKLKIFSDYRASPIVIVFFLTPLTLAVLMGGAISADMSHHWYDILGGGILGTFIAFVTYRQFYAAVFDNRINHIGLENSKRFAGPPDFEFNEYDYHTNFGFPVFRPSYRK